MIYIIALVVDSLVPRGGQEPLNLYEPNLGLKNSIEPFLKLTSD